MKSEELESVINRGIAKYREKMVGAILQPQQGHEVATKDVIRHFANALGDSNPLWTSEDYANESVYGSIIAPPLFLNAISEGQAIVGLPGLITTFVGAEWEWFRIIRLNDRFSVTNRLLDLEDKGEGDQEHRLLQAGVIDYTNQKGEVAGSCKWNVLRTEMKPGPTRQREKGNQGDKPEMKPQRYSDEDLHEIYATIDTEKIRGPSPRYFEDVEIGDKLQPVVKGPLSISDMVAWAIGTGWHRIGVAHELRLLQLREKPGLSYRDPDTGTPEPIANSHFWPSAAKILMGSPLPLDLGFQRICWLGHLITNWMSDYGFLKKLSARLRSFVRFGDTNWCSGRVVNKWKDGEEFFVEVELLSANQRGEITMNGNGLVLLPSKTKTDASDHLPLS